MRRWTTNIDPKACDARPISFGSAGALEFVNEYSGLALEGPAISLSQNSSWHGLSFFNHLGDVLVIFPPSNRSPPSSALTGRTPSTISVCNWLTATSVN